MYEWDDAKSARTLRDRGFSFDIMEGFLWDFAVCVETQEEKGELREKWLGPIGNKIYVAIVTPRDTTMRVISLRIATQTDIRVWRREVAQ